MKKIALILLFSISPLVYADNWSFGGSDAKPEMFTSKELRDRLEVVGEIYVTNSEGTKLLYQANESRLWKFGSKGDLLSNWSFKNPYFQEIAIRNTWKITDQGTISIHIEQFDSMKEDTKNKKLTAGKLIREQKFDLKDFAPINWIIASNAKQKVIVRLIPRISEEQSVVNIQKLPITLKNGVIYDSKGNLWAEVGDDENQYILITTHKGTLAVSYYPFAGAKEIGYAEGNQITILPQKEFEVTRSNNIETIFPQKDDFYITIKSDSPFLGSQRRIKVYGLIDLNKKTERLNSVRMSSSYSEASFLRHLKERVQTN